MKARLALSQAANTIMQQRRPRPYPRFRQRTNRRTSTLAFMHLALGRARRETDKRQGEGSSIAQAPKHDVDHFFDNEEVATVSASLRRAFTLKLPFGLQDGQRSPDGYVDLLVRAARGGRPTRGGTRAASPQRMAEPGWSKAVKSRWSRLLAARSGGVSQRSASHLTSDFAPGSRECLKTKATTRRAGRAMRLR